MEFVYVVPREALFPDCYPQGLVPFGQPADDAPSQAEFMERIDASGYFVQRSYAERTPSLKQVIPYTVVVSGEGEVFLTRRLPQGGEARLVGKLSIGIGGHINPVDHGDIIAEGTARELEEELELGGQQRLEPVGLINDDSNPVGAVHVGLVQMLFLDSQDARVREEDVLEGGFVDRHELARLLREGAPFESWSRMLVERLDELLELPQPAHT
jgi:predicted NUDIX family phosphoesterase